MMNAGYLSYLVMTGTAILLLSGWRSVLLNNIPPKVVFAFYGCWLVSTAPTFEMGNSVLHLVFFVPLVFGLLMLGNLPQPAERWKAVCAAAALGLFARLLLTVSFHPVHTFARPELAVPLTLAVAAALTMPRSASFHLAAIPLSLCFEQWAAASLWPTGGPHEWGGPEFQDRFWLTIAAARGLAAAAERLEAAGLNALRNMSLRKGRK